MAIIQQSELNELNVFTTTDSAVGYAMAQKVSNGLDCSVFNDGAQTVQSMPQGAVVQQTARTGVLWTQTWVLLMVAKKNGTERYG